MTESFDYSIRYKEEERYGSVTIHTGSTLDFLKKKLLRKFNYLASNTDKISIYLRIMIGSDDELCYSMPLLNASDMFKLIKRELDCGRSVNFVFQSKQDLTPAGQRKKTTKVEFDSDGDVESIQSEYELVIPSDPIYKGKAAVNCTICHRSNNDKEFVKLNGPFFGPFDGKTYCHLLCAIWAPKVYLHDETDKLMNIGKQIKRGLRTYCFYCGKKGGVLGCQTPKCKVTAHFDCSLDRGCQLAWDSYTMLCRQCIGKRVNKKEEP